MAYNIILNAGITGLTLTVKLLQNGTIQYTQSLPESSISGIVGRYAATITSGPTDGTYDVVVTNSTGEIYGDGKITLSAGAEIDPSTGITPTDIWTHPSRTLVPVGGVTNLY
jgi:hypothetical protein